MALPCAAGLALPAGRARPVSSPAAGRRPSARGGRLGHPAPQPQRSLTGGTARSQRAAGPSRPHWAGPAAAPRGRRRSPPRSPLPPDFPAGDPGACAELSGAEGVPGASWTAAAERDTKEILRTVHSKVKAKLRHGVEGCLRSIEREGLPHFPTHPRVSRHNGQGYWPHDPGKFPSSSVMTNSNLTSTSVFIRGSHGCQVQFP